MEMEDEMEVVEGMGMGLSELIIQVLQQIITPHPTPPHPNHAHRPHTQPPPPPPPPTATAAVAATANAAAAAGYLVSPSSCSKSSGVLKRPTSPWARPPPLPPLPTAAAAAATAAATTAIAAAVLNESHIIIPQWSLGALARYPVTRRPQ